MKEFDFDELDKAVNSLMGDIKKPEDSTPPSAPAPATDAATPAEVPSPVVATPSPANEPKPAASASLPTPDTAPSLVQRQSGRFMDVVHPSSDMKTAAPTPAPSREGVAKQPLTIASRPTATPATFDMVTPSAAARPPRETPAPESAPSPESKPPEATPSPTPTSPSSEDWSSPFLPDAQVEKRPLGGIPLASNDNGLSEAIAAELSKEPSHETTSSVSSEQPTPSVSTPAPTEKPAEIEPKDDEATAPAPESSEPSKKKGDVDLQLSPEAAPALPAELNSDLVAIESGKASDPTVGSPSVDSSPAAMLAASSIPTQYSEQPSTGDASHTPIYDNEATHQPLAHPAKKKKGWLLIVFIIAILVIGGALGAAAYFLHLI